MIWKMFTAQNNPQNLSAKQQKETEAPWPWGDGTNTEPHIRGLVKARVRFLVNSRSKLEAEFPDLSSALQELGRSQIQRLTIAKLWREEVFAATDTAK